MNIKTSLIITNELERTISSSRLSTYQHNADTQFSVLRDYIWNAKLSENFYFLLQNLEVGLRNSVYAAFKQNYPSRDFFFLHESDPRNKYLSKKEHHSRECWKMICGARRKLHNRGITVSDGRMIAELNFGFWTELLISKDTKYLTMWRTIFKDVFPGFPFGKNVDNDVKLVGKTIDQIRQFRNRIFHYEPICHNGSLQITHSEIMTIIGWIEPQLRGLSDLFDEFYDRETLKKEIGKKLINYQKAKMKVIRKKAVFKKKR